MTIWVCLRFKWWVPSEMAIRVGRTRFILFHKYAVFVSKYAVLVSEYAVFVSDSLSKATLPTAIAYAKSRCKQTYRRRSYETVFSFDSVLATEPATEHEWIISDIASAPDVSSLAYEYCALGKLCHILGCLIMYNLAYHYLDILRTCHGHGGWLVG